MKTYLDGMRFLLDEGENRGEERTGTGTRAAFGTELTYDLRNGFPLVTTKEVYWYAIVRELLWFISGSSSVYPLQEQKVRIWNEWADAKGELGPVYGVQWRSWGAKEGIKIDQLTQLIDGIKNKPQSRRHIISAWNVGELDEMALPPCHLLFQLYVSNDGYLDLKMYQRSADWFLGVPFNIASYSLLLMMIAQVCVLKPRKLIITFGDYHLYLDHLDKARLQLEREPRKLPTVRLDKRIKHLTSFRPEHIHLKDYDPHPKISAKISV